MVPVQHCGHGAHVFGEHAEVHGGVAHFHHAAQQSGGVDFAQGFVHGAAIAADFADVAGHAFVFGDELGAQGQVGAFEDFGALGAGGGVQKYQRAAQQQGGGGAVQAAGCGGVGAGGGWHGGVLAGVGWAKPYFIVRWLNTPRGNP